MIEVSNHARERFAEWLMDKTDALSMNQYIANHASDIDKRVNDLITYGELLYSGSLGNQQNSADYYIKDNICIIVADNKVVTLYNIVFNFPAETNKIVVKSLVEEIKKLNSDIEEKTETYSEAVSDIDKTIQANRVEINDLKVQIDYLNQTMTTLESSKKELVKDIKVMESKQKGYAYQLFANTGFKKDLKNAKGG